MLETWIADSHTNYFDKNEFQTNSKPKYDRMTIVKKIDENKFNQYLKIHQKDETDYFTFCKHCAEAGIEKWIEGLNKMACTYYDKSEKEILIENVATI
jgi:uncharacterized protein YbcV (DUF1398 family)